MRSRCVGACAGKRHFRELAHGNVSALRKKKEPRALCQLLEDELKEQKAQADALAALVEELDAKAAAEATVESAQESAAQERARLLRSLEEACTRMVRVTAAGTVSEEEAAGGPHTSSAATTTTPLEVSLQQCRGELDEARAQVLQLSGAQHEAQELQRRCDELTEALRAQRSAARKLGAVAPATLAAALRDHAEEVARRLRGGAVRGSTRLYPAQPRGHSLGSEQQSLHRGRHVPCVFA
ncbi:hypothetical protein LSCM1_06273 [Leishmania martiniquensis]|uniref:Uncharacterized protein n=1 Tax=Leishmania martiniquensis TaxID=1580590 RepID=A0A836GUT8_9TRYP|nr:hypothetical protein LSCM1_06273 [Leishmania martiniquensis]